MIVRNNRGFTMVELLVAMVIFVFAMLAATNSFTPLVNQFKQQGKITETEVEGIVGLELLRYDVELAGTGLPWNIMDVDGDGSNADDWKNIYYPEASATEGKGYEQFNDTDIAPRAILVGNEAGLTASLGMHGSDYLVLKAINVRPMEETQKWSYTYNDPDFGPQLPYDWQDNSRDLHDDTKVILIKPEGDKGQENVLVTDGAQYVETFIKLRDGSSNMKPFDPAEIYVIYGVGTKDDVLRMPFNRADYYISSSNVPTRCAPGTGVLVKSVLSHDIGNPASNGTRGDGMPLLDCVADMQIIVRKVEKGSTSHSDTFLDPTLNGPDTLNAAIIRDQLKEIRIYILTHEGQKDDKFTFESPTIDVGEFGLGHSGAGPFNFAAEGMSPDYEHYRWKVYTLVMKPDGLNFN